MKPGLELPCFRFQYGLAVYCSGPFLNFRVILFMYMSVCLLFVCGYLWRPGEVAGTLKLGLQPPALAGH